MQSAAIYQLSDRILIHPWNVTTAGVRIAAEPFVSVPLDTDAYAFGEAVLDALSCSGRTVAHPTIWKGLAAPRLKAAGVRSEAKFQRTSRYVAVEGLKDALEIQPYRNGGTRGDTKGHEPMLGQAVLLPRAFDAAQLGSAVRTALQTCE